MGLSCFKSWKHDSTGHKGNRDVLASPGSYFFLSNSGGQGDEWLKSLNKGVWIPFTGVFGQRLEETVLYERRYGVRGVPLVVEQCVGFMRERGLQEVGLFRQPGRASLVRELQEAFDAGERPTFDSNTDVHTVASLLKLYLRQLPEPLVPHNRYQDFLLCGQRLLSDRALGLSQLRLLLHELPVVNFNLLDFVCQFLNEVQSYSGRNRMSCQNLATVFGPNILRAKAEDPQSIMGGAALVQVLMSELIREHPSLFSKIPPSFWARPAAGLQASPLALRQPHLQPAPCLRQLSLPLISEGCWEAAAQPDAAGGHGHASGMRAGASDPSAGRRWRLGHRHTSSHPENCFPPAPAPPRRQPPPQQPGCSSAHSPVGAARAWPGPADAELWGSPEVKPLPAAAPGGDSEALEDSTPSAYDNLDREDAVVAAAAACSELCEEAGQTVDSASSWSSCEFLPLDKSGEEVAGGAAPHSPSKARLSSGPAAQEEKRRVQEAEDEDEDEVSARHGPSPSPASPLSTGSSEVFLPSAPSEGGGGARSLLAELREQMVQQRAQYQDRIHRLERCNDALERQVAVLRLSLEQQKRSFSVAEIKIQNMERAKADADRRNASLQREMQLFLQKHADSRGPGPGPGPGGPRRERTLQSL